MVLGSRVFGVVPPPPERFAWDCSKLEAPRGEAGGAQHAGGPPQRHRGARGSQSRVSLAVDWQFWGAPFDVPRPSEQAIARTTRALSGAPTRARERLNQIRAIAVVFPQLGWRKGAVASFSFEVSKKEAQAVARNLQASSLCRVLHAMCVKSWATSVHIRTSEAPSAVLKLPPPCVVVVRRAFIIIIRVCWSTCGVRVAGHAAGMSQAPEVFVGGSHAGRMEVF